MSTIVVYQSETGFTKKYAEWIAEALDCEAVPFKKVNETKLKDYDKVIYGGWLMGGAIVGVEKIKAMNLKDVVVFATGASPAMEELVQAIRVQNHLEDVPFFYFESGINYEKMGFMKRSMLKMVRKNIMKKPDKTESDKFMEKALEKSYDNTNKEAINGLVESVKA
ncbi:MAG: hypothetical protein E7299_09425 [Lachnospiraceae bacterium]|nr:hypothetical protein [Lachnospiraceae bacterium]